MPPSATSLYRQVAAEGATYIGLLTVVLDSLAEDLRLAGLAAARHDIPARCSASNHAFLMLAHLESWATDLDEPALKSSLLTFYTYLRSTLLTLQSEPRTQPFLDLATHVTQLRITWQTKESALRQNQIRPTASHSPEPQTAPRQASWSA